MAGETISPRCTDMKQDQGGSIIHLLAGIWGKDSVRRLSSDCYGSSIDEKDESKFQSSESLTRLHTIKNSYHEQYSSDLCFFAFRRKTPIISSFINDQTCLFVCVLCRETALLPYLTNLRNHFRGIMREGLDFPAAALLLDMHRLCTFNRNIRIWLCRYCTVMTNERDWRVA